MLPAAPSPVKAARPAGGRSPLPADAPTPHIIGTAGHIDHGKSRLVLALTGVDPDRLPEEKARGITIDLGFAPVLLPGGVRAAFVDVPGHERFVHTMVAGASGVDLALLVVAADEGPMPQTAEHLAILELLGVERAVVALTKVDLVDEEWRAVAEEAVRDLIAPTPYRDAPVLAVSALRGDGLDELRRALADALAGLAPRPDEAPARLAVDRVFTRPGFGTVVTGTLVSGRVRRDDRLRLYPADAEVRVRGVQVHGEAREEARAGERTALNLGGVEREAVRRGDVVAAPGAVAVSRVVAADVRLVADAPAVRTGRTVHVHTGTAQCAARLVWLAADERAGGAGPAPARLHLARPLALAVGDRFILRTPSPPRTIGGGVVLDPAGERYRRWRAASLAELDEVRRGGSGARVRTALARAGGRPLEGPELAAAAGVTAEAAEAAVRSLAAAGAVREAPGGGWVLAEAWRGWERAVADALAAYHREHPLRPGAPREEVRRRAAAALDGRRFALAVEEWRRAGWLRAERERLALADFRPASSPQARQAVEEVEERFRAAGLDPPAAARAVEGAVDGEEILALLVADGRLVHLGEGLYLHAEAVARARTVLEGLLAAGEGVTASAFRDALGASRRVAVPLLEHFDRIRLTRRQGDVHVAAGRSPG
jgi:selenocysteine-specific elongation factor